MLAEFGEKRVIDTPQSLVLLEGRFSDERL
jgi:hypothetical protein